jgi:histidine triad (HIT) family protein
MSLPSVAGHDPDCIFCRIVSGTIPAEIIHNGQKVLALLDRYPIHPGHTLIIPKAHCVDLLQLPADVFEEILQTTQAVARALTESLALEGFNVFSNNGEIAGQSVFHFHMHVTPRFRDDSIRFAHGKTTYAPGEMALYGERIRKHFQTGSFKGV